MERAVREGRLLITEDKDFGQLVYAKMEKTGGVIFIRFRARVRRSLPATVVEVVRRRGQRLIGSFTVLQPRPYSGSPTLHFSRWETPAGLNPRDA